MTFVADIRYALRLLVRSPIFALTSVLSLTVGIAATTAIFSVADALLLRERVGIVDARRVVDMRRIVRWSVTCGKSCGHSSRACR